MAPELIGKTLNRYSITSLVGEDGMGAIFKGLDSRSQKEVTVRVIAEAHARSPGFEQRFLLAARKATRLDHPGIVKVFDFGKCENYLYLVTESSGGEALSQKLEEARQKREYLQQLEVVQIVRAIVTALDYASKLGIEHIDIHPSKIILRPGVSEELPCQPVITDLGIAWQVSGEDVTQEVRLFGSPVYFSPEQARGAPLDIRSDVYTCGVLLYELATAKLPFKAKTIAEVVECQQREQPRPPRIVRPNLPENLEKVILKALEKDPENRFPDLASFAQVLERVATRIARNPPSTPIDALPPRKGSLKPELGKKQPAQPQVDYILVEAPDRPAYSIPITKSEMSIGRGKAEDIPLNSLGVSRTHARLLLENRKYYLVDLDSTNGTFLDEGRLLPGVRDEWSPGKVVRIGAFSLRLERSGKPTPEVTEDRPITQIRLRDGTLAEAKHIHVSSGEGRINVVLEEDDLEVAAGESVSMTIVLGNQGETVDHFRVNIEGVPPSWVSIQPQTVFLMPENQGSVQATFKPPKNSTSKAGIYDLIVQTSSTEAPDQKVEVIATLTVLPFVDYSSELHPQKIDTNQKARITIRNQGNNPETFILLLKDKADKLKFTPPQAQLQIAEGQPGAIEFSARPKRMQWLRKPVTHAFTADLSVASGGEKRTYSGEVVSNGLIPGWLPPLMALLCLALSAAAVFGYKMLTQPEPTPTAVAVVSPTPTAMPPWGVGQVPSETAAMPTLAITPSPTPFCPGAPKSQAFNKGDIVEVSEDVGSSLNLKVHSAPEYTNTNIYSYSLPIGTKLIINKTKSECFTIAETGDQVIMWQVKFQNKPPGADWTVGWVVEAESNSYYIKKSK